MVFVNSQKFACASCIKGHRSSSCHHTERPLFEIKKKGRPISQCETCRELRQSKHMHVKCTCQDLTAPQSSSTVIGNGEITRSTPHRSAQRKIPSTPTLPNGLQDLWSQRSSPSEDNHPKQTVDALLNPCNCKSVWKCRCSGRKGVPRSERVAHATDDATASSSIDSPIQSCCGGNDLEISTSSNSSTVSHGTKMPTIIASSHREERRLASVPYAHSSARWWDSPNPGSDLDGGLDLPPLKLPGISASDTNSTGPYLPSLKDVYPSTQHAVDANALAVALLTRCSCGSTCACPGCKEHRGEELAALSGGDCPDKCGSCVDRMGGIGLPSPYSIILDSSSNDTLRPCHSPLDAHSRSRAQGKSAGMSTLDRFYAIAALLPPPPQSRVRDPKTLDPTNVAVYQQSSGSKQGWFKAAGLVQVPPLNCCAGRCKCPGGMCGCGTECGGSCRRHETPVDIPKNGEPERLGTGSTGKENGITEASCCGGKKTSAGGASKSQKNILRL